LAATYNTIDNSTITPFKYYLENVRGIDPRYPTYRNWIGLFGYSIDTPPAVPAPEEPDPNNADPVTLNKVLDVVSTILDIIGFIPGIGDIADGVNTGICLLRGDLLGAALSAIGIIPVVGSAISVPLKIIFKAAGNITEIRAAINVLAGVFGGLDKVVDGLTSAVNTVRGLIRGIPDSVASITDNTFVRNMIGDDGTQAIGTMIAGMRNKVDDLIDKADEVMQSAKKSAFTETLVRRLNITYDELTLFGARTDEEIADFAARTIDFDGDLIEHIFKGEFNTSNDLTGFHYEGFPGAIASVKPGTVTSINQFGVYEADVIASGTTKTTRSSFFPKEWSPKQVVDAISNAYMVRGNVSGNLYSGTLANGMEILMRIDSAGKIITAYPVY
jgi:hypothetical protein